MPHRLSSTIGPMSPRSPPPSRALPQPPHRPRPRRTATRRRSECSGPPRAPGGSRVPTDRIIFSRPHRAARELANLEAVLTSDHSHGDGPFTAAATAKLRRITGARHALLTTSCTHALDMAGLLLELGP